MAPRPVPLASERGSSLVEVLVAVLLLGLAGVTILGALGVSTSTSTRHRDHADVSLVLATAAEIVKADTTYVPDCATATAAYQLSMREQTSLPDRWAADNLSVVGVTCPAVGLQHVMLRATAPGGSMSEDMTVAKADRPSPTTTPPTTAPGPEPCRLLHKRGEANSTSITVTIISVVPFRCPEPIRVRLDQTTEIHQLSRSGAVWRGTIPLPATTFWRSCGGSCQRTIFIFDGIGASYGSMQVTIQDG